MTEEKNVIKTVRICKDPDWGEDEVHLFKVSDEDFDLKTALHDAMLDYLDTDEGREYLDKTHYICFCHDGYNCKCGTYFDVTHLFNNLENFPEEIFKKYGFSYEGLMKFDYEWGEQQMVISEKETKNILKAAKPDVTKNKKKG